VACAEWDRERDEIIIFIKLTTHTHKNTDGRGKKMHTHPNQKKKVCLHVVTGQVRVKGSNAGYLLIPLAINHNPWLAQG
jgi:hypothetical protein